MPKEIKDMDGNIIQAGDRVIYMNPLRTFDGAVRRVRRAGRYLVIDLLNDQRNIEHFSHFLKKV